MMSKKELCNACATGYNQTVEAILARGQVDVNSHDQYGTTPLMWAMCSNHPSIVTTILAYPHTKLDCSNTYTGDTGLHYACCCNSPSVIPIIGQDRRCTPDILNIRDRGGRTPLMRAAEQGYLDCVKELDRLEGTDFQTKNSQGETLIEVTRRKNHAAVVQYLEERMNQGAANVATNTLERMNQVAEGVATMHLRDIAEELANLDELEGKFPG